MVHGGAEGGGSMACRTTIGECVFIVMQKSQEGGVKQRKTVLKLCRGDRSNLAVKCLPVLHCWAEQETEEDESGLFWIGEIGLRSLEIAVIWRQAADSCGQVLDRLLLLLLLLCLDKKPEYAGMGIYGPVMMTRSWIGAND